MLREKHMMSQIIGETNLPLTKIKEGKVRELYDIKDKLLLIATDRISAFDWVLPNPIPHKGICLTQLSAFWFDYMHDSIPNHVISTEVDEYPKILHDHKDILRHRSMLVKKAKVLPVECIVRGYITGSAWKSYTKNHTVCGISLPEGLRESEKFPKPLFTPSTKAETGHDVNISFDQMKEIVGDKLAQKIKTVSLELYKKAAKYALQNGIIIADTKFEFGLYNDELILVDELFTPDSSRFWPAEKYVPGKSQPSFDKQYVRDYLSSTGWDKNSEPPELPTQVILETEKKYIEAYEKITGTDFSF